MNLKSLGKQVFLAVFGCDSLGPDTKVLRLLATNLSAIDFCWSMQLLHDGAVAKMSRTP